MTPGTRLLNAARASTRNPSPRENLTERERDLLDAVEALSDARALYPAAHAIGERVSVVYPPGEVGIDFVGVVIAVEFSESKVYYRVRPDDVAEGWLPVDSAFVHPAPEPGCIVGARIGAYAGMALAELRMHEWSVDVGVEQNRCPACRAETKAGHRAGCLLHEAINARLAEVGAAPDPPPRTLPLYRAPGVSGGPDWTVEDVVLDSQPAPSWFPMDGRRVAEEDAINRFITEELPRRRAEFVSTLPDVAREVYAAATGVTEGSPGEAPYEPVTDKDRREAIARAVIRSKPGPEGGACDIDYRAAALVLFQLLDDIDTLDDACRENDVAFRRLAMVKARRREDVGASFDGYTVAFIGERAYAEGEKRTSKPSRAEESPTSSIADVQKATFDPAVHGNGVPGFGSTNTLHIPGRVQITRHTDEHGVKTTETVDLRDPDALHARFAEALGAEWKTLTGDARHEWLAAFERAVEIAETIWTRE